MAFQDVSHPLFPSAKVLALSDQLSTLHPCWFASTAHQNCNPNTFAFRALKSSRKVLGSTLPKIPLIDRTWNFSNSHIPSLRSTMMICFGTKFWANLFCTFTQLVQITKNLEKMRMWFVLVRLLASTLQWSSCFHVGCRLGLGWLYGTWVWAP